MMLNDPDLFGNDGAKAHARWSDPDTSHEAADDITPSLRPLQVKVLAYAFHKGERGFTDPEMSLDFECLSSTLRSRRAELVDYGLIEDTGNRQSFGGRSRHAVWRVSEKGRDEHLRQVCVGLDRAA